MFISNIKKLDEFSKYGRVSPISFCLAIGQTRIDRRHITRNDKIHKGNRKERLEVLPNEILRQIKYEITGVVV